MTIPADHRVQLGDAQGLRLFAAEGQQLPRQVGGATGGGKDLLNPRLGGASGDHGVEREFGVAGDDGEQIVEVMGNASSQAADGVHFL